jgi:hypothetical protein
VGNIVAWKAKKIGGGAGRLFTGHGPPAYADPTGKKKPADEGRLESTFLGGKIEETGASCLWEKEISNLSL